MMICHPQNLYLEVNNIDLGQAGLSKILVFGLSSYSGADILKIALAGSCIPKFSLILSFAMKTHPRSGNFSDG